MQLEENS